ncbi:MAG: response regulator transcription factor [Propionibacteriaceae bacterium]|nr:response regulator transcription factor [Propionibacteriaceae bacterium]
MTRILVVDDDSVLQRTLRINLRARGHEVLLAGTGEQALATFLSEQPELVILDLGLPDLDGVEVLRRLRKRSGVPVIVLSARQEADDKVEALDEGADDYVSKPFSIDELLARVRAAVRRAGSDPDTPETIEADGLVLDFAANRATRDGHPVHLTPTEWRLLAELARHRGRVVSHEDLLRAVWGPHYGRERQYLRVFANQLRRKLEVDPAHPRHLVNEPGLGYRLELG